MILYAKHLILMSLALFLGPIVGRWFARASGRAHRIARPGLGFGFLSTRLLLALAVPFLAQALFAWLTDGRTDLGWSRYFALGVAGAVYGAFFGDLQDYPLPWGPFWGAIGGVGTAFLYESLPPSSEGRAFCVALFAAVPLLAFQPYSVLVRKKLGSGGLIVPNRRLIR